MQNFSYENTFIRLTAIVNHSDQEINDPLQLKKYILDTVSNLSHCAENGSETDLIAQMIKALRLVVQEKLIDSLCHQPVKEVLCDRRWVWERARYQEYVALMSMQRSVPIATSLHGQTFFSESIQDPPFSLLSPFDNQPMEITEYPLAQRLIQWISDLPALVPNEILLPNPLPLQSSPIQLALNRLSFLGHGQLSASEQKIRLLSYQTLAKFRFINALQEKKEPILLKSKEAQMLLLTSTEQQIAMRMHSFQSLIQEELASSSRQYEETFRNLKESFEKNYNTIETCSFELGQKLERLEVERESLQTRLLEKKQELARETEEYEKLKKQSDLSSIELSIKERRLKELRTAITQDLIECERLQRIVQEMTQNIALLDGRIASLQQELESIIDQNNALKNEISDSSNQLNKEKEKSRSLKEQIKDLEKKSSKLKEKCESAKQRIDNLGEEIEDAKDSSCTVM